ncbi:IS3 family transposase [Lentzea flava]|uniref:IS3 family transposase n=1 Tax=Lentzea flava TaxID=103732 RepID=UPI001670DC65
MRLAESFFGTVKAELLHRHTWSTRAKSHVIFEYIENRYNMRRRRSTGRAQPRPTTRLTAIPRASGPLSTTPCRTGQGRIERNRSRFCAAIGRRSSCSGRNVAHKT